MIFLKDGVLLKKLRDGYKLFIRWGAQGEGGKGGKPPMGEKLYLASCCFDCNRVFTTVFRTERVMNFVIEYTPVTFSTFSL